MKKHEHPVYKQYLDFLRKEREFSNDSIPLCASENVISPFSQLPLKNIDHEKYLLGGTISFDQHGNFIGSANLYNIYDMLNKQCSTLYKCAYSDARTLSGLNCITSTLMALTNVGDTILLSSVESGGHSSMEGIARRLGLKIIFAPYDYKVYDYDYDALNHIIKNQQIKLVLLSPSNILYAPKLERVTPTDTIIVYDASQTLGMIASGVLPNPLDQYKDIICIGSTHKTIPGPTSGLILTNNMTIAKVIDEAINPQFVSSTQLSNKLILLHSLIELEFFGQEYASLIQSNVKYLSKRLEQSEHFELIKSGAKYSETHQILLGINEKVYSNIENNALAQKVTLTLSTKRNRLFNNQKGLRIGLQEVSMYNWKESEMNVLSKILDDLCTAAPSALSYEEIANLTNRKNVYFSLEI